jgi:hypothetical protein
MENQSSTGANQHPISHSPHNNPSIAASSFFGMVMTAGLFAFLGLLIGLDRAPGSFYSYGLSCFFWPIVSMILLGSVVGGSLGYVFGAIAHASDDTTEEVIAPVGTANVQVKAHKATGRLTLHLPRH